MLKKLPLKKLIIYMVLLAIAGLIGITVWAERIVDKVQEDVVSHAEENLRVPAFDAIVYTPLWVEYLKEQPKSDKPTIGMFGSSTVFGTTVKDGWNTPSGILQQHLHDKRVLNLGLSGGRLVETYAMIASMIDEVDVVVYEINYGILPITDNNPDVTVYPTILSKLDQNIPKDWVDGFSRKNKNSVPSAVHDLITTDLLNEWTLYHDRDVISYHFLKTRSSTEKIRREIQKIRDKKQGIEPTYTPLFSPYDKLKEHQQEAIVKHFTALYKWEQPFDKDNSFGLFMMEKTLDLLDQHKKKAIFFTAPLDKEFITEHDMLNWNDYNTVMGSYQDLIESRGYPFIEFNREESSLIPHKYYHDPSHLIDKGSKMFGEILYERLKTLGITEA